MARKKKSKIPPYALKAVLVIVLTLGLGFVICKALGFVMIHSPYFKITTITYDPELQFINKRDLANLKGKSIFEVDLLRVQKKLSYKYPQASNLKIVKRFPNQIAVVAKKRLPFAQSRLKNRTITLDSFGVVLSLSEKEEKKLPFITGLSSDIHPRLGTSIKSKRLDSALEIIKSFQSHKMLSAFQIAKINVENLSKINVYLANKLLVILDQDKLQHKIRILDLVLAQGQLDLKNVRYVDLRFKEPIVGKK